MILLGLTGGVGMGKSTVAGFLADQGVRVLDTDGVAREVVEPGEPALEEIRSALGAEVIGADGRLRRDVVAGIVFRDAAARQRLEAILHPRILVRWQQTVAGWKAEGVACAAVVIPLLFETGAGALVQAVVCVACSAASQEQRLLARGWSREQSRARQDAQWPVERKVALARFVIWTEGDWGVTRDQVGLVLRELRHGRPSGVAD